MARVFIAFCCLLAVATSAAAECAWVLWTYDGTTWRMKAPFETYQQCREDIKMRREQAVIKEGSDAPSRLYWNREAWRIDGIDHECWPDTVDPRGPKGK